MTHTSPTVLVLGASGMLGHTVFRVLAGSTDWQVWGSLRSAAAASRLPLGPRASVVCGVDVEHLDQLASLLDRTRPDLIVNCIGLVKQLADADDPLQALPINALLPHRLARLARLCGARLVHVSTDCVFAGTRGGYLESDAPDAQDLYGRSKLLGEVVDQPHVLTLRTSIIGPELGSAHGLVGWFLSQQGTVRGYTRAVFSGLPTVELAGLIRDHVVPRPDLHGLYHVSAAPINKHELLQIVDSVYAKGLQIVPDDRLAIDRSLDSTRWRAVTGYQPPTWRELVQAMHDFG